MIDFKPVSITDRQWAQPLIEKSGTIGCDISFMNTFVWSVKYDIQIAKVNGYMVKAFFENGKPFGYSYPIGENDLTQIKKVIDIIIEDAQERGVNLKILLMTDKLKKNLKKMYHNKFEFKESRDDADYIYNRTDLADLAGRKYHSKRNHISRFLRENENVVFKPLNDNNIEDALYVAEQWCLANGCAKNGGHRSEFCAIKLAFENFKQLEIFGGILYVNDAPVAMTAASKINNDVCDVHFEKALPEYAAAYTVINNEFAKYATQYNLLNREEDMGLEGLRKAKLSYKPEILLDKHIATLKK